MTNEEKTILIAYLVDAGEIDPDGDVESQFLDWYQVREETVLGEIHYKYKAVLDAARVRARSYRPGGYRHAGDVGGLEVNPKLGDLTDFRQVLSGHSDPCGCYAEGYAAGRAEAKYQHRRDRDA